MVCVFVWCMLGYYGTYRKGTHTVPVALHEGYDRMCSGSDVMYNRMCIMYSLRGMLTAFYCFVC